MWNRNGTLKIKNYRIRDYDILITRDKIIVISCHPGSTDTDLSKPFQKNIPREKLLSVESSVSMMLDVIWKLQPVDTGKFYAYDGSEIPF